MRGAWRRRARTAIAWGLAVAYREFIDNSGTTWRVWDTHPVAANTLRTVSPNYAGGWLTFESATERRRLAPIPPDWEVAGRQLMADWCVHALPVRAPDREARPTETRRL
jgi:hypothetical protein